MRGAMLRCRLRCLLTYKDRLRGLLASALPRLRFARLRVRKAVG